MMIAIAKTIHGTTQRIRLAVSPLRPRSRRSLRSGSGRSSAKNSTSIGSSDSLVSPKMRSASAPRSNRRLRLRLPSMALLLPRSEAPLARGVLGKGRLERLAAEVGP
jgi:hypothetical protein